MQLNLTQRIVRSAAVLLLALPAAALCDDTAAEHEDAGIVDAVAHEYVRDTTAVRIAVGEVRAGLEHSAAARPTDAAAAYARATDRVPSFASWSAALSAAAAAKTGDTAAVRKFLARTDTALAREWGWRARVDAAAAAQNVDGAARLAEQLALTITDPARKADALTRAGLLHERAGRRADAIASLRRAIDTSIGAAAAIDAARTLATLGKPALEDRLRIARVYTRHGNFARAGEAVDAYIAAGGGTAAERARLQLELGRGLFNARQYVAAEQRLRAARGAGAARADAAEAAFLIGRSQYRRNLTTQARATFERVIADYAGTESATRAHFILGDIEHDAARVENARTHYRAVIEAGGADATVAAMRLGIMALIEGRAQDAANFFYGRHTRATAATEKQQAGFWWARSLERAGAADSARAVLARIRALDPFSYYGMRAGELIDAGPTDFASMPVAPAASAAVRDSVGRRIDVIDVLRAVELTDAANFEMSRVVTRFSDVPGALYALGAAYHARGQTGSGIAIGRDLRRREGTWNRQMLELVYPFPFRESIEGHARAHELDPYLVAGLIRQESMFNPRARSAVGALGLMQVMPATGKRIASSLGVRTFTPAQLTDPAVNVRFGTKYFADQIRSHGGRVVDALAAYNAGPHRVAGWRQFPEYRDAELFAERIPFQETRDYVKIVQQNARIYRELYGRPAS